MSQSMSLTPSISDYLLASDWAYDQSGVDGITTAPPAGLSTFNVGGSALWSYNAATGFYAAALATGTGQIIIVFEGTNFYTGSDTFTQAQTADDLAISAGVNAPSYADALSFTQTVIADAETAGYSLSQISVAGHSLGAAEAEYVATQTGLGGMTFGTPGIPTSDIPAGSTGANLTNYVERGDPVGNYAAGGNDDWLLSPTIVHYGVTNYIGSYLGTALLYTADGAYDEVLSATTLTEKAAALSAWLGIFATAVDDYHVLSTYASDLGVTLPSGDGSAAGLGQDSSATIGAGLLSALGETSGSAGGTITLPGVDLTSTTQVSAASGQVMLTTGGSSTTLSTANIATGLSLQSDGAGGTTISFGLAPDGIVLGGSAAATIQGDASPLVFVGGTGAVSVLGGSGAVTLYGATSSTATSFLMGGSGTSLIHGGAGASTLVGGSGASTLAGGSGPTLILANGSASEQIQAGAGATTVNGLYGTGPETVFAGAGADIIALGSGADSVLAGSGAASVIGGRGSDVYGFIDGHAGGSVVITGLKATDSLAFAGYAGNPITSEGVLHGSDLITLSDGTVILLSGLDHKIFS